MIAIPPQVAARRPAATFLAHYAERLWLSGALALTLLFAARTMAPAFQSADTIQDDARQHVFWMLRFRDPELFRDDLIADYYQSLAPPAYSAVYWLLAQAVDPLQASKLLPPVLGTVAAICTFRFVRWLHPSPAAAFLATVLASWYVWQHDDLASASPRAFLLPLLTGLLWSLAAGRLALSVLLVALAALLYPTAGALGVALLGVRLIRFAWPSGRPTPAPRSDWLALVAAAALVGIVLAPSIARASAYGPTVTADQARTMPELGPNGRTAFFVDGAYRFWLESHRSGLNLRVIDPLFPRLPILFEYAVLAAILPPLLLFRRRLPAARLVDRRTIILLQLLGASVALFALAHLLLFRLYLPARYVQWSVPLVFAVAAGLALVVLFEWVASRIRPFDPALLAAGLALLFAAGLALYPARYDGRFQPDHHPAITAYLRAQPKDVLVAAAPSLADSLPSTTGRRVLAGREYALAYHLGYYREVRPRLEALVEAYYDEGSRHLVALIEGYGVDLLVIDRAAFDARTFREVWDPEFEPFTSDIAARLRRPRRYALQDLVRRCAVVDDGRVVVIPASCIPR